MFRYIAANCNLGSFTLRLQYLQFQQAEFLSDTLELHLNSGAIFRLVYIDYMSQLQNIFLMKRLTPICSDWSFFKLPDT
jgi:hypothetical protein